ncbi:hypothetical protein V496_03386 [Pseudogymnoascus sp. VKM F-4515 (FW-2607)]|nr:hypothetical protein V496_03386 [Pseudogymnoascus sp. VKM F-4515 (FW-2607)]
MFTSSVRRAAFAAQPSPIAASLATSVPRAVSTQSLSCRPLQRRYSSSKPSSPADGSKGVAEGSVPAAPAQTRSEGAKKKTQRTRKAKGAAAHTVKGRDEAFDNLPSVPSTHHLQVKDIAASTFFSLHRPISVTSPFPKPITHSAFASIFATTPPHRVSDVLSTLSSTVRALDGGPTNDGFGADETLRAALAAEPNDITHLDGQDAIPFPQHILTGRYQPFNAPAPPVPMPVDAAPAAPETAQAKRTYTATLTIEESTSPLGEVTYVAHSSPLQDVAEPTVPTAFRERMRERRQRYVEERAGADMWALSVKRQRKLKMKKHKYKKLMRRTRNLRRRLDRN